MKIKQGLYFGLIVLLVIGIVRNYQKKTEIKPISLDVPVVVELFTAKNCPSCPPADRALDKLAQNQNVIALSCHVSYLDYEGNRDDLTRNFCDVRQNGYANMTEQKQIFTPQIIINGAFSLVGGNNAALNSALKLAAKVPPKILTVNADKDNVVSALLPTLENQLKLNIWAFGYSRNKGSNPDRPITNAALSLDNLGPWDGKATTRKLQVLNKTIDSVLILAQDNTYGQIIAAGHVDLR